MKKIVGYIIALIGLFVLAYSLIAPIKKVVPIPGLDSIPSLYSVIAGLIIVIVGIFLVVKSPSAQKAEVPIYEGESNKVVGYRKQ